MICLALVDATNLAAGKRDAKSCTTTTCFDDGIGPNRSTDTCFQFWEGTICGRIGAFVLVSVKIWQSLLCLMNCPTFKFISWKKKCVRRRRCIVGWLPRWQSWIASVCKDSGRISRSPLHKIPLPVRVISDRVGRNFSRLGDAVLGIHAWPFNTILSRQ